MTHLHRPLLAATLALSLTSLCGACDTRSADAASAAAASADAASAGSDVDSAVEPSRPGAEPDTRYRFGPAVRLGAGRVRTYLLERDGRPLEIGVSMDEAALENLPKPGEGTMGAHGEMHELILALPARSGTSFQFVELDWNPGGHEPQTVYTVPHFDFHFYTISKAARDSIDPRVDTAGYAAKANRLPAADLVPQHYALPLPPGTPPVAAAVPRMGVHMVDMRSPELQGLLGNHAGHRAFSKTFIVGSWDGGLIFWEPMITRDYLMGKKSAGAQRDELIPLPAAQRYAVPGAYPESYRIAWDAERREYRVGLSGLVAR